MRFRVVIAFAILLVSAGGCAATRKPYLRPAEFTEPMNTAVLSAEPINGIEYAETTYRRGVELEGLDSPDCVLQYLQCAKTLWPLVSTNPAASFDNREATLYRSAVGKVVEASQRFDLLDHQQQGLQLSSEFIPVRRIGFPWHASEVGQITVVGDYSAGKDIRPVRQNGLGVPLLMEITTERPFVFPDEMKAATAIVRPDREFGFSLDIVNTLLIREINVVDCPANPYLLATQTASTTEQPASLPIAFDLTAPMAYFAITRDDSWKVGFLRPSEKIKNAGLSMVEPYQPGKIPVVFVHGLASDPMTWAAMANELFHHVEIMEKYQFLIFSYPTGTPFPTEAANLRRQLVQMRKQLDPERRDAALDKMVLIGHSMGGLISKLQITSSQDRLFRSIFAKPFEQLELTEDIRQHFANIFYFEPSTQIKRVIFVGTPHRGSKIASNPIGRLASRLVEEPAELVQEFSDVTRRNVDALVTKGRRVPTSIDLLRPDDKFLNAMYALPVNPNVTVHTLIGTGHGGKWGKELGDGVVPVSSARHPGAASELFVDAGHGLHHHPATIQEVVRILHLHAGNVTGQR